MELFDLFGAAALEGRPPRIVVPNLLDQADGGQHSGLYSTASEMGGCHILVRDGNNSVGAGTATAGLSWQLLRPESNGQDRINNQLMQGVGLTAAALTGRLAPSGSSVTR